MKLSLNQLEMVLTKLKYSLLDYSNKGDLVLEVSITQEDPGKGSMVDCLSITAAKPNTDPHEEITMSVEVYPPSENLDPICTKSESFKIKKSY